MAPADAPPPFDPFDPELRVDPYPVFDRYRSQGPVQRGAPPLPGYPPGWYVFGRADVVAVLGDAAFRQERSRESAPGHMAVHRQVAHAALWEAVDRWMLLRDPPAHSRLRAAVSRAFSSARLAGLRVTIEQTADRLIDAMHRDSEVDLVTAFAGPLPVAVIGHLLGIDIEDPARFRAQSRAIAAALDLRQTDTPLGPATAAMQAWVDALRVCLADKRRQPGPDLASDLLAARGSANALDEDELVAMLTLLLFTAQETTSDLIGNAIIALLHHPDQLALLRREPSLLGAALDEVMRFESPVQAAIVRTAGSVRTLGGKRIAVGDSVVLMLGAANRDPGVFQEPHRFDIRRRERRASVAFGHGVHFCLGAHLARLEAEVAIARVLARLPDLAPAHTAPVWRNEVAFRGPVSLRVRS